MENAVEMSSSAMEQEPMDAIGSTENMLDRNDSIDCAASSLVKITGSSQQHSTTASSHSGDDDNQVEMDIGESIEQPLKEKQLQLMDLNDDCLSAIFKHLPLLDLISVADVCKRFRSIAQENFWLAKPIVNIPQDVCRREYNLVEDLWEHQNKSEIIGRTSRLFRNFGSLITKLEVESVRSVVQHDERIVTLIMKYCDQNLTALKLHLGEMKTLPIGLKPIIQKLKRVDFKSDDEIDASIAEWLTVVEDLTLETSNSEEELWAALLKRSFENLRRIRFPFGIDCHELAIFLERHTTIIDMHIEGFKGVDSYKLKIPAQIENMRLVIDDRFHRCIETSSFKSLKFLKSLELRDDGRGENCIAAILRAVAENIQLKHVTLYSIVLDMNGNDIDFRDLGSALSKLVHLDTLTLIEPFLDNVDEIVNLSPMLQRVTELQLANSLRLDTGYTIDDMVTIVSCLHNLQRLKVSDTSGPAKNSLGSKTFKKVIKIVLNRNNDTRLNMELHRSYKLKFSDDLARRYRHILSVKELD